jgi:hypothetical protein
MEGEEPTTDCRGGRTRCDDKCVDLRKERKHCGACGNHCERGFECRDGACQSKDDDDDDDDEGDDD